MYLASLEVRTDTEQVTSRLKHNHSNIKAFNWSMGTLYYPDELNPKELCSVLKTLSILVQVGFSGIEEATRTAAQVKVRVWEEEKQFWKSSKRERKPLKGFPNMFLGDLEFGDKSQLTTLKIWKDYTPGELRRALGVSHNWYSFAANHQVKELLKFLENDDLLKQTFDCLEALT